MVDIKTHMRGTWTYADGAGLLRARVEDDERDVVHHVALVGGDVPFAPVDRREHLMRCTPATLRQTLTSQSTGADAYCQTKRRCSAG